MPRKVKGQVHFLVQATDETYTDVLRHETLYRNCLGFGAVCHHAPRFKHNWGTAEKLYKSEAIDSFGNKYLLGVFETVAEAEKAFDEWNKEYEQAGENVKESLSGWAKQQEAALAEDQDEVDRLRKALEEARR